MTPDQRLSAWAGPARAGGGRGVSDRSATHSRRPMARPTPSVASETPVAEELPMYATLARETDKPNDRTSRPGSVLAHLAVALEGAAVQLARRYPADAFDAQVAEAARARVDQLESQRYRVCGWCGKDSPHRPGEAPEVEWCACGDGCFSEGDGLSQEARELAAQIEQVRRALLHAPAGDDGLPILPEHIDRMWWEQHELRTSDPETWDDAEAYANVRLAIPRAERRPQRRITAAVCRRAATPPRRCRRQRQSRRVGRVVTKSSSGDSGDPEPEPTRRAAPIGGSPAPWTIARGGDR
jgi:hypothetical protein